MPAVLRRPHRPPGDAVAGAVEAAERPLEAGDVRQERLLGRLDAVEHDLAGDRGAQGELALDFRRRKPFHALLENEAADLSVVRRRLRPDDENVGDRRVADPGLRARQPIAVRGLFGPRLHAAGIGAGVRLGQAEASDEFAASQSGQVSALLPVVAVGEDRIHDERALHAHHRAKAGVDALDLACDETVGDVAGVGAAVVLRQRQAEESRASHQAEQRRIGLLLQIGALDARPQFLGRELARRVADQPLVLGQLALDEQRIVPLEGAEAGAVEAGHCSSRSGMGARSLFRLSAGVEACGCGWKG